MPARLASRIAMLVAVAAGAGAARAAPPTADQLLRELGFDGEARAAVRDGSVVTNHPDETSKKELAVRAAVVVPAPLEAVMQLLRGGRGIALQEDVVQWQLLPDGPVATADLSVVGFGADDDEEVRVLLEIEAGDELNLSAAEITRLRTVARRVDDEPDAAIRTALAEAYRAVLAGRLAAYRRGGVTVIAPYARADDETATPGAELAAAAAALGVVRRHFPAFHREVVGFPARGHPDAEHRFAVVERTVEDRPTFVLLHLALVEGEGVGLLAERQLYVGHSYNSAQTVFIALPIEDGTLIVCETRSATDRVTGLRRPVAKRLGRGRLAEATGDHLRAIRAALR